MSIDLKIGFRQKPEDLGEVMASIGYALDKVTPVDATFPCRMVTLQPRAMASALQM